MGSGPVGGGGSRPDEELEQAGPCQRGREALTSRRSTRLRLWSSRSTTGEAEDLEAAGLHPLATGMARRQRRRADPGGDNDGQAAAMASVH